MPELPDLAILADALDAGLVGRRLMGAEAPQPLVLRGTPAELQALAGQRLLEVSRRGKFLTFAFERDRLVINAMLTGRLGLGAPGSRPLPATAAVLSFTSRVGAPDEAAEPRGNAETERTRRERDWPGRAGWLPPPEEPVELRYRDATRMGKVYVVPAGVPRPIAGWAEQGPDADDPDLDVVEWRRRITRHSGEIKNLLRNQQFIAGIGNAYSDEILWAARLAPFRTRASLASAEVDELHGATRDVLAWAIGELRELVPPRLEVEQRGFLRVHHRGGQACQRCGSIISEISAGGSATSWCRGCQR